MTFPGSLSSYVIKELIKIVFFYILGQFNACLNKNFDYKDLIKSQIGRFHAISE